jgi:micrococcal nuclease
LTPPETVRPSNPAGCFGPEASAQAHKLLDGQVVRLETDPSQGELDKYDRVLAYVWLRDGRMFNEVMIKQGFAAEYTYGDPYRYMGRFRTAEKEARATWTGMWRHCPARPEVIPGRRQHAQKAGESGSTDRRYDTCSKAVDAGLGPYRRGVDGEYGWYADGDRDGLVCET